MDTSVINYCKSFPRSLLSLMYARKQSSEKLPKPLVSFSDQSRHLHVSEYLQV